MRSDLFVVHRLRNGERDEKMIGPTDWVEWETCVRRIAIGTAENVASARFANLETDEIYRGSEAYQFLLEVVCGLKSPVVGETEVHGQFKDVLERMGETHPLHKLLHGLHLDARKVRLACLQGLGSQSYGSLARRKVRGFHEVHILGSGQLTRDILPWLAKLSIPIHVYARNPEKHQDLTARYKNVKMVDFAAQTSFQRCALLIAAPLSAGFISDWLAPRAGGLELILDYRGESMTDPLRLSANYLTLKDIFQEIQNTKQKVDAKVEQAKLMIQTL